MKIGLSIPDFTWPGGPATLGSTLAQIARTADQVGFQSISVMDHFWQIGRNGPPEHDMLEGYTALAFMAGVTPPVTPGPQGDRARPRYPPLPAQTPTPPAGPPRRPAGRGVRAGPAAAGKPRPARSCA